MCEVDDDHRFTQFGERIKEREREILSVGFKYGRERAHVPFVRYPSRVLRRMLSPAILLLLFCGLLLFI